MGAPLQRLKRRPDFLRARAARNKWVTPGLILQVRSHDGAEREQAAIGGRRVGFTVSRKVGGAVVRNRVKRRLKSAADAIMTDHAGDHRDYVVIGRAAALTRPYPALLKDLETALKKLDAYVGTAPDPVHQRPGDKREDAAA